MILIDWSQVALSTIFQFQNDLKKSSNESAEKLNIIRHAVLTGLKSYKQKYGSAYGEMVIACDGRNYWRKEVFPHYKAGRKAARDKSDLDWDFIFKSISQLKDEIREVLPYKVVSVDRAEADDIIAVLAKWTQSNGHIDHGVYTTKQPVMIISSDGDYKQLHRFDNVKQYSPIQKKMVTCSSPIEYLAQHIAKAGDDGIPNVLSSDDVFVTEGVRQKPLKAARLAQFIKLGRDACETDIERRNWDRNNQLVNFACIPPDLEEEIVNTYIAHKPNNDKMKLYDYFVKNRCRLLLDSLEEF